LKDTLYVCYLILPSEQRGLTSLSVPLSYIMIFLRLAADCRTNVHNHA